MSRPRLRVRDPPRLVFYTTTGLLCLLVLYSFATSGSNGPAPVSHQFGVRDLVKRDEECRLVHHAADKCAFVKLNCPDEEAGLVSYLRLYYCDLPHAKPVAFGVMVIWACMLFSTIGIASSDFLCVNLGTIASILGMSENLAGVTFLAFGNGSPDVFSTFAAMKTNSGSLAVGELMGAAGFITAVVAGSMALVKPFKVARKSFVRDVSFFAVAAAFSLVFLADGSLRIWECVAMVSFYVFYVAFVVAWHWWIQRNRRIKLAETSARLHYHISEQQELEAPRIEIDDEDCPASERTSLLPHETMDSFPPLPEPAVWRHEDMGDDDDARNKAMAELSSNMRVGRPARGERRHTGNAIRPSLIGALEFRSVLNNLERKATYTRPINLRRYTDEEPEFAANDDWGMYTTPVQALARAQQAEEAETESSTVYTPTHGRTVSANDAAHLGLKTELLGVTGTTQDTATYKLDNGSQAIRTIPELVIPDSFLSPGRSGSVSGGSSPATMAVKNGLLAPPTDTLLVPDQHGTDASSINSDAITIGPPSPVIQSMTSLPKLAIPDLGSKSPQQTARSPRSRASSIINLPTAFPSSGSVYSLPFPDHDEEQEMVRYSWWPYDYLPAPQTIISTLFPTLYGWSERSLLDKLLGLITAVPVFLLTATLPVVESESNDQPPEGDSAFQTPRPPSPDPTRHHTLSPEFTGGTTLLSQHPHGRLSRQQSDHSKIGVAPGPEPAVTARQWNRWLVIVQIFLAPLFVVTILCANMDEFGTSFPLKLTLGSLVFSLIGLLILLATSTAEREPKYRSVLCFMGFAVSIAWISTIANEVVGVLKAVGVILDISDAILGLTVFAMGNSVGDLVADITIARLGYPVMALSACFGGPMLNILLGIGIGGLYMTVTNAHHKHHKHPDRAIRYKPYQLDVSTTLMISGAALLVTLLGLLIVVPLNNWRMDRKIGAGLIILWATATITNVVLELVGVGNKWEYVMKWLV